ncbi:hypothetical protein EMCRGX_G034906 [Ephydatia muelleri]
MDRQRHLLSRIRNMVMSGWQPHIGKDEEFIPYKLRDMELSMKDGCAIKVLRNLFATPGLLEMLVSDSDPAFTSAEFQVFERNGFRHVKCAPYHP